MDYGWTNDLRTALSTCAGLPGAAPQTRALEAWLTATQPPAEAAPAPVPTGSRYQDLGLLARGGMGEVRRVFDTKLNRVLVQKVLRDDQPQAAGLFYAEACITARLEHPCIVPIHDFGNTEDGRPFYTMKSVEGRTFRAVIQAVHSAAASGRVQTADGWGRRRLLSALIRACEALALAHTQGVVHRDIKPDNMMIGAFGEVLVMDWGLAMPLDHLAKPPPAGTPGYMAPEQARGEVLSAATDVFALGSMLCEILTGRPAVSSPERHQRLADTRADRIVVPRGPLLPEPLRALAAAALSPNPSERPPDAGTFAEELRRWLDDDAREAEARDLVSQADALLPQITALEVRAARDLSEAREQLDTIPSSAPSAKRHAAWAAEDAARERQHEASLLQARYLQTLRAALSRFPSFPDAHQRLADHYQARAEATRNAREIAEAEAWVRRHDQGRHAAWLSGRGEAAFFTDPPGAQVRVFRFTLQHRRLVPVETPHTAQTPCPQLVLEHGSYIAEISHPECGAIRVPFVVPRGGAWNNTRPGSRSPHVFRLPQRGALRPSDRLVPAGWAMLGNSESLSGMSKRAVWVDGFLIQRHPVTNARFIAFLNDLVEQGREEEALRWQPKEQSAAGSDAAVYGRDSAGRFILIEDSSGDRWHPQWPVVQVDWAAARAWCRWHSAQAGRRWRLPWELEREKATIGVDGRLLPWGKQQEATWCRCRQSQAGRPLLAAVGTHPHDESPYGAQDMAGNCRDWCADLNKPGPFIRPDGLWSRPEAPPEGDGWRSTRGGAWSTGVGKCQAGVRFSLPPGYRISLQSIRAASTWEGPHCSS